MTNRAGSWGRRVAELALEAVMVVFAVMVALGVEEWRDDRQMEELSERARAAVEAAHIPGMENQPDGRITISVGVSHSAWTAPCDLVEKADAALYESKRAGRGKVSIYSRKLEDKMREQAVVEQALRKAIAEKTIEPHYQPIVDLKSGKILGFEALARWTDPELGSVPPTKFIAIAEERGLIGDLTDLLFEFAAAEAAKWPKDSFLSFNLSTVQLADVGTGLKMMSAMSKAGLDPRRLEIEITETALLGDVETAKDVIRQFRSSGVGVALDDFGTGHSSLGYLRELPLDKIKIDRSFVSGIETEKQSYHIIKAVLELCAGLELKVVAEGIEERQQASRLISHGCGAGQGYLFGRPMPAANAHKLVWASARSEEQEFAVN